MLKTKQQPVDRMLTGGLKMQLNSSAREIRSVRMTDLLAAAEPETAPAVANTLKERSFVFTEGLLGFPEHKNYQLERFRPADGSETPFFVLRCLDDDLSFPVIHPASLGIDYRIPISHDLLIALGATSVEMLVVLLIVTVRERIETTTVNLQGPLVMNSASGVGLQLVVEEYPLRHPMLIQIEY
jgi:flagellar assembly factor FliW